MSPRDPVLLAVFVFGGILLGHGDVKTPSALPGSGFSAERYAGLWTKSPFAIATPDAPAASEDYQVVGLAQFDGVSYASLIDKQTHEHFVLASDKPQRNLTLVSVSHDAKGASAVIQRNGEILTLQQEEAPQPAGGLPISVAGMTGTPQFRRAMPAVPLPNVGGMAPPAFVRPLVHFHRPPIAVPSQPPPK
jgi:hypothetical protein